MNIAMSLMNIGTWALVIASIPQLKSIWKDRKTLTNLSKLGSGITFGGLALIAISFILSGDVISFLAQVLPLGMWFIATVYAKG